MTAGHVTLEYGVRLKRVMAVVRTLVSAGTSEPPVSVAHSCAARHCVSQRIRQEAVNGHRLSAGA